MGRCSYCEAPLRADGSCCMVAGWPHDEADPVLAAALAAARHGQEHGWRSLGYPWHIELWYRIEHRINFWRNREFHRTHCTCKGSGIWT